MAYTPSINDIPMDEAPFTPTVNDLPSEQIINQAQKQEFTNNYNAQPQEEFSNPTQMPGFENLSKSEKLKRIAFSQFDPANQTATGGFLPGGAYESPITRGAASFIPTLAAPELRGLASALNPLLRVGAGTAGNIAYQSPNIKSLADLKKIGLESAKSNALMEWVPMGARMLGGAAEVYNPAHVYAAQKANEINNEYRAARALQRETYRPVMQQYGNLPVTQNPINYLANLGIEKRKLYPESRKIYDAFVKEPTFQNLHDFQSKLGGDIRQVRKAGNKPKTTQQFEQYRNSAQDAVKQFLSQDQNSLNAYNLGSHLTRNVVEPYRSMPTLRKITGGTKIDATPEQIAQAIKSGREKITGEVGNNVFTAIPEGHPLERHFNEINSRMNLGKTLQKIIPEFWKKNLPNAPGIIQSPTVRNALSALEPSYYLGSRAAVGQMQNQ